MRTINRIVVAGRLGRDPEIRVAANGNPWGTLSVATSRNRRDGDNNWVEDTDWHNVRVFGSQAEFAQKYMKKGDLVSVEGSIQYDKWVTPAGEKRSAARILGDHVQILANATSKERESTEGPIPPIAEEGEAAIA